MQRVKQLSNDTIAADRKSPPSKGNVVYWDTIGTGLGARITASGHVSFVYRYVVRGRERRFTIGDYGPAPKLTVTAAREIVRKRDFRKDGVKLSPDDPLGTLEAGQAAKSMNEFCELYLSDHAKVHKRASSIENDTAAIERYIKPVIGKMKVAEVTTDDIEAIHRSLKGKPYQANRVLALLSKMFSLSMKWTYADENGRRVKYRTDNPCKGIQRFAEEKRERYLETDELQRLVAALAKHPNQQSANAIRLLLMTGARRGEVLSATWTQFDLGRGIWTKPSSHTKQKRTHVVPLSAPAMALLASLRCGLATGRLKADMAIGLQGGRIERRSGA